MDAFWASAPLEPTCRLPAVDLFLIIIHVYKLTSHGTGHRTSCIRDEQTTTAATFRSGHEFIHGEKKKPHPHKRAPLPPRGADIYEDILSKIIIIALPFRAATSCVMIAFVALPSLRPSRPPSHRDAALPPPPPHPLYPANVTRQGEGKCRPACPSGCVESRLAAARFTPVLHSQSDSIHHPPPTTGAESQL